MTIDPFMEMLFRINVANILHRIFCGILGNYGMSAARTDREMDLSYVNSNATVTPEVFSWYRLSIRSLISTVKPILPVTLSFSELPVFHTYTCNFNYSGIYTSSRLPDFINNRLFFRRLSHYDHENKDIFASWKHVKKVMPVKKQ